MVTDFVRRKHGHEEVKHIHPLCAPILEDTYGVLLYQEQVMKIAMTLASFDVVQADDLRSAMGKKKHDKIAKLRQADSLTMAGEVVQEPRRVVIGGLLAQTGLVHRDNLSRLDQVLQDGLEILGAQGEVCLQLSFEIPQGHRVGSNASEMSEQMNLGLHDDR